MKVSITQEDIEAGVRCSACRCPVARATQRACGVYVGIAAGNVCIDRPNGYSRYVPLPSEVNAFINRFDLGGVIEPMEFEIDLTEEKR